MSAEVHPGDCRDTLRAMAALGEQFDSVVTDPPYDLVSIVKRFGGAGAAPVKHGTDGLYARQSAGFMGKKWDGTGVAFDPDTWRLVLDVMKPGAHLVAFGGSRTYHRMAVAIEDAGFEIRDSLMWLYGQGFPKSHDVSKGIDATLMHGGSHSRQIKKTNETRPGEPRFSGALPTNGIMGGDYHKRQVRDTPATPDADQWDGWGTALKPAFEPIILARAPLGRNTVARNVLEFGTGAMNIDACRVPQSDKTPAPVGQYGGSAIGPSGHNGIRDNSADLLGRWPANVMHDGSEEVMEAFPNAPGQLRAVGPEHGDRRDTVIYGKMGPRQTTVPRVEVNKSAARFFYCAKANAADRAGSKHPTVKPQALMRWLCTLITPPGGRVLDPFAGSGSTLQAALACGFDAIGCEADPGYVLDIHARLRAAEDPDGARMRVEAARKCKNPKEGIHQLDLEEYLAGVRNGA